VGDSSSVGFVGESQTQSLDNLCQYNYSCISTRDQALLVKDNEINVQ
jgi:hypothetical protein